MQRIHRQSSQSSISLGVKDKAELEQKSNNLGVRKPLKSGLFSLTHDLEAGTQPITVESFDNQKETKNFYKKR